MKNFLVYDDYGNTSQLMNYKDLKELLIDEIERDTIENHEDKSIVTNNFKVIRELTKDKYIPMYITRELEGFGYYVQDLTDLQEQLTNFQAYKHGIGAPSYPNDCIEQTLKMIEEEMK